MKLTLLLIAAVLAGSCALARRDAGEPGAGAAPTGTVSVVVEEHDPCAHREAARAVPLSLTGPGAKDSTWLIGWMRDAGGRSLHSLEQPCKESR